MCGLGVIVGNRKEVQIFQYASFIYLKNVLKMFCVLHVFTGLEGFSFVFILMSVL